MSDILKSYDVNERILDEVKSDMEQGNQQYDDIINVINQQSTGTFKALSDIAKVSFLNQGITYALYKDQKSIEQIFPFDLVPRLIDGNEWSRLREGLIQRNTALNLFLKDVYTDGAILRDGIIPTELIKSSVHYCKIMEGFRPPGDIYCHICGTDLIRHTDNQFYVLEDNLRNPSGVSYVLTNRIAMSRVLPEIFDQYEVEPVNNYSDKLLEMLWNISGKPLGQIFCALLTPGSYNSAYFEHTYLAQKMGIELVEGRDLVVQDDHVYIKAIGGPIKVDVIYRRIDDDFLDPAVFNSDSLLGVKGLMEVYKKGNVVIINAPGTGISDDKAVCSYVPDMIKYYLDQDPIIPNVPTYICSKEDDLQYVREHISDMVVKPVDMSGGYGVTICDQLTKAEQQEVLKNIEANPRDYIAQPKMMLSTHMTYIEESGTFEPRHIDLRTFTILGGKSPFVLNGGLTRTALRKGSLIVNSSQGGGSKDTWVLKE